MILLTELALTIVNVAVTVFVFIPLTPNLNV